MSAHFDCRKRLKKLGALAVWLVSVPMLLAQTAAWNPAAHDIFVMQEGKWRIDYHLSSGTADILCNGVLVIPGEYAEVRLPQTVTSRDYKQHRITSAAIHDGFGNGRRFTVESSNGGDEKMLQTFWLYQGLDYILADVEFSKKGGAASNFMSPLTSDATADFLPIGDCRALFVPFDNDMWIRYNAVPFGGTVTSYEVSALYDNTSREGLVLGSVTHDVWKTGVVSTTSPDAITGLQVFGGITSTNITHDVLPHGKVRGELIKSPKIFIGRFLDWREGLETYARANAIIAPPRPWAGGPPFGWNSWGKLQFHLNYDKAIQVSDFFAKELPDFKDDGVIYLGLDAGWDSLSDEQLKDFVAHCHENHQEAGIYFTPFTAWTTNGNKAVEGTPWHYKDIFLYAHAHLQTVDGGTALDPTHPGTQALIKSTMHRFHEDGFTYVKADFMTHGALEADHYFDPKVTTGIEAYNQGMKFVDSLAGKDMYLNLSIAPLFPAQYANSRRISCDTFGRIDETEYMLNSLTYGWWLGKVYDFNDPDEIVLDGFSDGENRARVTSAAITGLFLSGDDFSAEGSAAGKQRAKEFLTNAGICNVAKIQKSFEPVEGNTGNHAGNLFSYHDESGLYLAVFNFSNTNKNFNINPERLGLQPGMPAQSKELWSGATGQITSPLAIHLGPKDAVLYRILQ